MVRLSEGAWSNLFFNIASQRCWKLWLFIPTDLGQTGLASVLVWCCQAMAVTLLSLQVSAPACPEWPCSFSQVTPEVGSRGLKALTGLEWAGMELWVWPGSLGAGRRCTVTMRSPQVKETGHSICIK